MPTPEQIEELDAIIAYINAHPEEHDQSLWICGTTACIAGHAVLRAGWKPASPRAKMVAKTINGRAVVRKTFDVARVILGLTRAQAWKLFSSTNSIEDIEIIRDEIVSEAEADTPSKNSS